MEWLLRESCPRIQDVLGCGEPVPSKERLQPLILPARVRVTAHAVAPPLRELHDDRFSPRSGRRDPSAWATPLNRPHDPAKPGYVWLADLLDSFGVAQGFTSLRSAIIDSREVTGVQMAALILPFGGKVARMLSRETVTDVFVPVRDKLITYLEQLPEPKFKLEKYDPAISQALRALKDLERSRGVMPVEAGEMIDGFRLKMCMKLLSCTTFDRQMNGLGEIALLIDEASAVNESVGQMAWLCALPHLPGFSSCFRRNQVMSSRLSGALLLTQKLCNMQDWRKASRVAAYEQSFAETARHEPASIQHCVLMDGDG